MSRKQIITSVVFALIAIWLIALMIIHDTNKILPPSQDDYNTGDYIKKQVELQYQTETEPEELTPYYDFSFIQK